MPVPDDFRRRLDACLPAVAAHFGTPFYLYDEQGIVETLARLRNAFEPLDFREFYAVKAVSNPRILRLLLEHGAGFDCGSVPDIGVAQRAGAGAGDLIFTANNTTAPEFAAARASGALLNIDDLAAFGKLPDLPERVGFRLNPGSLPHGSGPDLMTTGQKFGLRPDQLPTAERAARDRGASRFGLHAMVASGLTDSSVLRATLEFLLEVAGRWRRDTGTVVEFIDAGGGLGIPFRPGEKEFDVAGFAADAAHLLTSWAAREGVACPRLYLESGRYVTGPHGVLVTRVVNRMEKWQTFVGVDTGVSAMIRPALYDTAYHHITVHGADGRPEEVVDVVGSMCENNDKLASARRLPRAEEGDLMYVHDVGAHGYSMSFPYNHRLRPQELLMRPDGAVELIRRAETEEDFLATLDHEPRTLSASIGSGRATA